MSTKSKIEYIWLDGYKPTQSLRSKTRIESTCGTLEECPMWSFDGSSTEQATGGDSDVSKPVAIFPDPGRKNGFLVMTEVLNADGSPHESNGRATIADDDEDFWFGRARVLVHSQQQPTWISTRWLSLTSRTVLLLRGCLECSWQSPC